MQEKLSFAKKILVLLSLICAIILYATYFGIYLINGGYAYTYRYVIIIGSVLLILYFGIKILSYFIVEKKIVDLLIGIVGIALAAFTLYLYFDANPRYLFAVNQANLLYQITFILVFVGNIINRLISKEKIELNVIISIVFAIGFLVYGAIELFNKKQSYNINLNALYFTFCCIVLYIILYTKKSQLFRQIWIGLACLCFLAIAIVCRIRFTTMDHYNMSTFLTIMALGLIMMRSVCKISYPVNKKTLIHLIINIVSIIIVFIVYFPIKNTVVGTPNKMTLINPYRILALFLIVLYIIDELFEFISKKSLPGCFVLAFSVIAYIVLAVIMMKNKDALYHVFYSYYLSTIIILIVGVLCLTIYKSIFFKNSLE